MLLKKKEIYIVSSCLLGIKCRYDGRDSLNRKVLKFIRKLKEIDNVEVLSLCPEVMGGLSIPRKPVEIKNKRTIGIDGVDYTEHFLKGVSKAIDSIDDIALVKLAILKYKSPSCSVGKVYDGSFKGNLIDGNGFFAQALIDLGIKVISEIEL